MRGTSTLPRAAAFWLVALGVLFPVVLRGGGSRRRFHMASPPGPVAVLGATTLTDCFCKAYALPSPGHLAGVRVRCPDYLGPPPCSIPGRPQAMAAGACTKGCSLAAGRCRAAVRRQGAARGPRSALREQCPRCRADRPTTRGQQTRAGGHHRRRPVGQAWRSAASAPACWSSTGFYAHPPDLVATARR